MYNGSGKATCEGASEGVKVKEQLQVLWDSNCCRHDQPGAAAGVNGPTQLQM